MKMRLQRHSPQHQLASYIIGFVLSLALTALAYTLVVNRTEFSHSFVIGAITALAFVQFFAQLVFFLHLGTEKKAWWKSVTFLFMVGVVLILVVGSLWIMNNLNYHMGHDEINTYLQEQDRL